MRERLLLAPNVSLYCSSFLVIQILIGCNKTNMELITDQTVETVSVEITLLFQLDSLLRL